MRVLRVFGEGGAGAWRHRCNSATFIRLPDDTFARLAIRSLRLDPANYGLGSSGSRAAYAASVIAANTYIQTIVTQGIALVSGAAATAAAERAVLTALAKKYIKSAPKAPASRRLLQASTSGSAGTVDLSNSTVVADLLTQTIAAAQASGDITPAAAATAQSSVAVVAAAVSNINSAVSRD